MSQIEVVRKISDYLHVNPGNLSLNREKVITRTCSDSRKITGFYTVVNSLGGKYKSVEEDCSIRQWVEYCNLFVNPSGSNKAHQRLVYEELNSYLATRSYFVGSCMSLADVVVFYCIAGAMEGMQNTEKEKYIHLCRWYDHLQLMDNLRQGMSLVDFTSLRIVR
ncbi:eukaryotic translation elongation factor 1 epsilon-1 [Sergentomyia squamirostris]